MAVQHRHHLSSAEKEILDLIEVLYDQFCALPEAHHSDRDEVARHLHAIQKIVGARIAYRTDPDRFPARPRQPPAEDIERPRGRHAAR